MYWSHDKQHELRLFCLEQIEEPYVWGAKGDDEWDCSGLVTRAFEMVGVALPHGSYNIYEECSLIPRESVNCGDLGFMRNPTKNRINHVALVLYADWGGVDTAICIEARHSKGEVVLSSAREFELRPTFDSWRRVNEIYRSPLREFVV